jgi:hypothetical protein
MRQSDPRQCFHQGPGRVPYTNEGRLIIADEHDAKE